MSLVDILFTAGGGGVFGSLLHLGTSWVEHKQKVELMRVQVEAAEKTEAWKAFTASQQEQGLEKLPASTPGWIAGIYVIVEAIRRFTRPGISWALLASLMIVFFNLPDDARKEMAPEITFAAFTAIFWYYGSRYSKSK